MDYKQTLQYLYDSLPMFSKSGAQAYKKDITNTALLCDFINNPHQHLKFIHIAGTNGKGSVSHILAAVFQQCGYKTGLYTSPHLIDFRERIKVNGQMISQNFVVDFVKKIKAYSEEVKPSFFELTVAMMLEYFVEQKVDIAIIETGLGGRLDSTNIIDPILSIITNISFDHTNILGNTLYDIAYEKAGIIKKNKPVVIGETSPELSKIFKETAVINNSPIVFAEEEYGVIDFKTDNYKIAVTFSKKDSDINTNYETDLAGLYQVNNLRTAVTALDVLSKYFFLPGEKINNALQNVKSLTGLQGRWEKIADHPLTIIDVGHNEAGIKYILRQIKLIKYSTLHIVIGMVKDKDINTVLSMLPNEAIYYFTGAHIQRALPANELREKALTFGLIGKEYALVNKAIEEARKVAKPTDLVIICGSVYLIGEVDRQLYAEG